jgi:hypothetical protein
MTAVMRHQGHAQLEARSMVGALLIHQLRAEVLLVAGVAALMDMAWRATPGEAVHPTTGVAVAIIATPRRS